MIKTLKKLLALAIAAVASASCGLAFLNDDEPVLDGDFKIVVNGVASDAATNVPLTGIKVTFSAFAENSPSVLPVISKTVYTDSRGIYSVEAIGFSDPVTCTITAESTEGTADFESMTNKVVVAWHGNSFDSESGTFYVNECNFQMNLSIP